MSTKKKQSRRQITPEPTAPEHPLVPKLVRGLLEDRRGGRWASTQENAYAWIALTEYAARFESETPDFDSQLWLGGAFLARASI